MYFNGLTKWTQIGIDVIKDNGCEGFSIATRGSANIPLHRHDIISISRNYFMSPHITSFCTRKLTWNHVRVSSMNIFRILFIDEIDMYWNRQKFHAQLVSLQIKFAVLHLKPNRFGWLNKNAVHSLSLSRSLAAYSVRSVWCSTPNYTRHLHSKSPIYARK